MINSKFFLPIKDTTADMPSSGYSWVMCGKSGDIIVRTGKGGVGDTYLKDAVFLKQPAKPIRYGGPIVGDHHNDVSGKIMATYFGNNPQGYAAPGFSKRYAKMVDTEAEAKQFIVLLAVDDEYLSAKKQPEHQVYASPDDYKINLEEDEQDNGGAGKPAETINDRSQPVNAGPKQDSDTVPNQLPLPERPVQSVPTPKPTTGQVETQRIAGQDGERLDGNQQQEKRNDALSIGKVPIPGQGNKSSEHGPVPRSAGTDTSNKGTFGGQKQIHEELHPPVPSGSGSSASLDGDGSIKVDEQSQGTNGEPNGSKAAGQEFLGFIDCQSLSNVGYESEYQFLSSSESSTKPTIFKVIGEQRPADLEFICYAFKTDSQIGENFVKYKAKHSQLKCKFDKKKTEEYTPDKFVPFPTSQRIFELFNKESEFVFVEKPGHADLIIMSRIYYLAKRTEESLVNKGRAYLYSAFSEQEVNFAGSRTNKGLVEGYRAVRSLWHESLRHDETVKVEVESVTMPEEKVTPPPHIQEDAEFIESIPESLDTWSVRENTESFVADIKQEATSGAEQIKFMQEAILVISQELVSISKTMLDSSNDGQSVRVTQPVKADSKTGQTAMFS